MRKEKGVEESRGRGGRVAIMNAECLNKAGKNEQADEDVSERADNGKQ